MSCLLETIRRKAKQLVPIATRRDAEVGRRHAHEAIGRELFGAGDDAIELHARHDAMTDMERQQRVGGRATGRAWSSARTLHGRSLTYRRLCLTKAKGVVFGRKPTHATPTARGPPADRRGRNAAEPLPGATTSVRRRFRGCRGMIHG
jgi:hypothetical protein